MTDDQAISRFIEVFGFTREKGLYYLGKHAKKKRVSEAAFAHTVLRNITRGTPRQMANRLMKDGDLPPSAYDAALVCAEALRSAAKYGGTLIEAYDRLVRKKGLDLNVRLVQNGTDISFVPNHQEEPTK